jgi:hypothetical protein
LRAAATFYNINHHSNPTPTTPRAAPCSYHTTTAKKCWFCALENTQHTSHRLTTFCCCDAVVLLSSQLAVLQQQQLALLLQQHLTP